MTKNTKKFNPQAKHMVLMTYMAGKPGKKLMIIDLLELVRPFVNQSQCTISGKCKGASKCEDIRKCKTEVNSLRRATCRAINQLVDESLKAKKEKKKNKQYENIFLNLFKGNYIEKVKVDNNINGFPAGDYYKLIPNDLEQAGVEATTEREIFIQMGQKILKGLIPNSSLDEDKNDSISDFFHELPNKERLSVTRFIDSVAIAQREYPILPPSNYGNKKESRRVTKLVDSIYEAIKKDERIQLTLTDSDGNKKTEECSVWGVYYKAPKFYVYADFNLSEQGKRSLREKQIRKFLAVNIIPESKSTRPDDFVLKDMVEENSLHMLAVSTNANKQQKESSDVVLNIYEENAMKDISYYRLSKNQTKPVKKTNKKTKETYWTITLPNHRVTQSFVNYLMWLSNFIEVIEPDFLRDILVENISKSGERYAVLDAV